MAYVTAAVGWIAGALGYTGTAASAVSAAATAATIVGAGVSAYSAYQTGQANKAAAEFNAAQLQQQALAAQYAYAQQAQEANIAATMSEAQAGLLEAQQKNLKYQGDAVRASAAENIRRRRVEGQRLIAEQRAAYAAAGVTSSGSPLAVLSDSAGRLELDLLDLQYDAENAARDLAFQADSLNVDIGTSRYNAKAQRMNASWLPKVGKYQRNSLLTEAAWVRRTGKASANAANITAAATLLQGAGSLAKV
jgi:hypothetical protein